jgi:DNA-binding NtrC family response regulator
MDLLRRYSWPGNVRELRNIIERAMVLSRDAAMDADLLPREITGARTERNADSAAHPDAPGGIRPLDEMERDYILAALEARGGNRSMTARALGIARSTLQDKLKKYGIGEKE